MRIIKILIGIFIISAISSCQINIVDDYISESSVKTQTGIPERYDMQIMPHESPMEIKSGSIDNAAKMNPRGVEYIDAFKLKDSESIGWKLGWQPDDFSFLEYTQTICPQVYTRNLFLQDIFAASIYNKSTLADEIVSLGELYNAIRSSDNDDTVINRNAEFVERIMQNNKRITKLKLHNGIDLDLDFDDEKERIEVNAEKTKTLNVFGTNIQMHSFTLLINDTEVLSFESNDAGFILCDLITCYILFVKPRGYIEELGEYGNTYESPATLYVYTNGVLNELGLVDGEIDAIVGEGRFVTVGNVDFSPNYDGPIYEMVREYYIHRNRLYHVRHQWLFTRTIWNICESLPLYKDKNMNSPIVTIREDSEILIAAYSPDGWLYIISENNETGYLKMALEDGVWAGDPLVMPGERYMTAYFEGYYGVAG